MPLRCAFARRLWQRLYVHMIAILSRLWPENVHLRVIHLLGLTTSVGTYSIIVYLLMQEAPVLLAENVIFFVLYLLTQLLGGALLAFLSYLPYHTASVAAQKTGFTLLFAVVALLVFLAYAWLGIDALFFPKESTSSIGILFFPFYLAIPVLVLWGAVHITSKQDSNAK